ncbi:hypothetical protein F-S17_0288 [Faustovirus]|nr:hypothetical protein F-LCD7_0293 [Faustovirus]QJX72060.1 hypothetical protein F-M6_0297 [Faustovirus]QJX72554.1 hypothetical protein F-S17_0288 [Faustovirus]QJX73050.1 hypothetical protein F-VV57_0289 [Faustovirus]QJX73557.1 hypothetical protein F-VV63_0291 [Faustovirus]
MTYPDEFNATIRAFDTYDEISDLITSTFSFVQCEQTVMVKIENRNRKRLVADAALFYSVYYNDRDQIMLQIMPQHDSVDYYYSYELTISE